MIKECEIQTPHSYFVAEVVGVPEEGKVFLVYLCTSCGDAQCKEFTVSKNGGSLRLLKEEKQTKGANK